MDSVASPILDISESQDGLEKSMMKMEGNLEVGASSSLHFCQITVNTNIFR